MNEQEEEAERIYELLRTGRMSRKALLHNMRIMDRGNQLGAAYLRFLLISATIKHGQPS
jgi:hypothetical protein